MRAVRAATASILAMVTILVSPHARADEGGTPFWTSGQFASFAAMPATPGWSLSVQPYFYDGSGAASDVSAKGDKLTFGERNETFLVSLQPGYAPKRKLWGGQLSVSLGFSVGIDKAWADQTLSSSTSVVTTNESDSKTGGSDLFPFVSLAWARGVHNGMAYVTGDVPVGAYDASRLANLGIGHAAIDAGGAYTYFDEATGWGFSALAGFTYNWKNPSTDYKNGVDAHLECTLSRFVTKTWQLGVATYGYDQLSADSYPTSGADGALRAQTLGTFESKVAAVGPQVGYNFTIGGRPTYGALRAYWEFWAVDRTQGYAVFASMTFTLGR